MKKKHTVKILWGMLLLAVVVLTTACSKKEDGKIGLNISADRTSVYSGGEVWIGVNVDNTFKDTNARLNIYIESGNETLYTETYDISGSYYSEKFGFTLTSPDNATFTFRITVANKDGNGDQKTVDVRVIPTKKGGFTNDSNFAKPLITK